MSIFETLARLRTQLIGHTMESCSKVLVSLFLVQRSSSEGKFAGTYNSLIIPDSGVHDSVHLLESEVLRRKARSQKAQGYSKTTTQSILLSQIHPTNSRSSERMKKLHFIFTIRRRRNIWSRRMVSQKVTHTLSVNSNIIIIVCHVEKQGQS